MAETYEVYTVCICVQCNL